MYFGLKILEILIYKSNLHIACKPKERARRKRKHK